MANKHFWTSICLKTGPTQGDNSLGSTYIAFLDSITGPYIGISIIYNINM